MTRIPTIAIFDVGKTNKKLFLFDEQFKIVFRESKQLKETTDEEGFSCEDVMALTQWVKDSFDRILKDEQFCIKAVNFSAYGASFVYLDSEGKVMLPLYNYIKPVSQQLQKKFYDEYGGKSLIGQQTASPALGHLNSGMQLYRLKYEKPEAFAKIKYALHLPQYLSFILSSKINSDITSIGCHTYLWDFQKQKYHKWVKQEGIGDKLPPVLGCTEIAGFADGNIPVGVGLHDSSAALIPYLISFAEPFILLSTGTWCISLNPFNDSPLSDYELLNDCLCYLSYEGKPVKASRLFAGYEHEQQIRTLAKQFNKPVDYFKTVIYNNQLLNRLKSADKKPQGHNSPDVAGQFLFSKRKLSEFSTYEEAYHQLMSDIMTQQIRSTHLALKGTTIKRIFVDGGFSRNSIYMHLLADAFPGIQVYTATVPESSAMGAALAIHQHRNKYPQPTDIIELKYYPDQQAAKH